MRFSFILALLGSIGVLAWGQTQPATRSFEVASVRRSAHEGGPDYNNQIEYSPTGFTGRNMTLRRLVAEAWHCSRNEVLGAAWLDRNEYDITTRMPEGATPEEIPLMLRTLLIDRFHLKVHSETREKRVYELTVGPGGPRIHPMRPGDQPAGGTGQRFHGDMQQFAEYLAAQISIPIPSSPSEPAIASREPVPVLDKTQLQGIYDFSVDLRPEMGTDGFTAWKRILEDQLGLKIESRKDNVEFVVVDEADENPTPN